MKVWVYHNRKLRQVESDRLDVNYPYNPPNEAKFVERRYTDHMGRPETKWTYVPYGNTKEECLERVNFYTKLNIETLKKEIVELEAKLVKEN